MRRLAVLRIGLREFVGWFVKNEISIMVELEFKLESEMKNII
jgi:hypothetical protein